MQIPMKKIDTVLEQAKLTIEIKCHFCANGLPSQNLGVTVFFYKPKVYMTNNGAAEATK